MPSPSRLASAAHTDQWFQGRLSSPDSKLHVYEGDGFRNRLVAKFESEEDAAAAVEAHNASVTRDADPDCDCMVCRGKRHRAQVWARHNAGQDYLGIRERILSQPPADPNWKAVRA